MNNGLTHGISWIDYDGTTNLLEVRLNTVNVRPLLANLSYDFDLGAALGSPNAFVGFGSGTGAAWGNHDILSWEFRDESRQSTTCPSRPRSCSSDWAWRPPRVVAPAAGQLMRSSFTEASTAPLEASFHFSTPARTRPSVSASVSHEECR